MILINPKTKAQYEVFFNKHQGEESSVCPECSPTRKKKLDKCFSFNHDKQFGRCNHCGVALFPKREESEKKYTSPPKWENKTELPEKVVKYFEGRGIYQETLKLFSIGAGVESMPCKNGEFKDRNTIQFPYFDGDEVVNIKYRGPNKEFKMFKGARKIFYNLNSIIGKDVVLIVEGEIDALSVAQAGLVEVVSVPNGATLGKCNLDYLDECIEYFSDKTKIYIATDDDAPGRNLQDQLAERLGKERCYKVKFKDSKDANECLVKYGAGGIIEGINEAKEYPLVGIKVIQDYADEIEDIYVNGLPKGAKTMMSNLNELISFHKGYFSVITGVPNMGKTSYIDQLVLQLSIVNDWKGAFYSPENKPTSLHISNLARKLIGKAWFGEDRISRDEIEIAKEFLSERFFFIHPEKDFTLKTILNYVKSLQERKGIDFFVIDAWNKLEHKHGPDDENTYIGRCLDEIATFCSYNNLHLFLVAHPRKMQKKKDSETEYMVPTSYDINGSAHFFNKPDINITVYRDYGNEETHIYIQKVKFDHWGKQGFCRYKYEPLSGRFTEYYGGAIVSHDRSSWIGRTAAPDTDTKIIQAPF